MNRTQSEDAFKTAQTLMPGGVNSPVRAFKSVGGTPVFIQKAKGPYLWDEDDNQYIDYVGSWGPAILGHAENQVLKAIHDTAEKGTTFGAPTVLENKMAAKVIELVPSIEKVRFVSSGTEAVMSAIRLARAYTGRTKIIKFKGCYHGHADYLLVKAGSGVMTLGMPDSAGISSSVAADTLTARFNHLEDVKALLEAFPQEIAAILVEPVAGNMGCIPPEPGFLEGLRELSTSFGALLVFDEVMTGFRVALGGAQERYQVMPDITTLGKIIGGGLPAAAYGGRSEIMAMVAPEGPMYQAGTLSGNPLAMAAGLETLTQISAPGFYQRLEEKTTALVEGWVERAQKYNRPCFATQVGSMFTVFSTHHRVFDFDSALQSDKAQFNAFFWSMLNHGVYLAPSQFEAGFVSQAHTPEDIEATLKAVDLSFQ
ncbi:MAG: glutamate-1-semialdehyde 2,1-aminomutase [Cyanobacteria bacterium]|nr:glutamate-1-semialdehyde 2,1-aminomutase [Cyanobacteriota bacterium]